MGRSGSQVQVLHGSAEEDRAAALQSTFGVQANALMRKNFVYQKRSWANNCCLLLTPVVLCAILGILQALINIVFNGTDFKCGCKCLEFDPADPTNCLRRDPNVCGVQYSTAAQSVYCPVPSPAAWPALLQVPLPQYRAEAPGFPAGCKAAGSCPLAVPFTGNDKSLAYELSNHLFEPSPALPSLTDVNSALASQYPGTGAPSSQTLQYELGFQSRYNLFFLENNTCSANVTQLLALGKAAAAPIYQGFGISKPQNWTCAPVVTQWNPDTAAINQQLFAGYRAGNPQRDISEYTAAYDWRNTSTSNFVVGIHYNSSYKNDTGNGPPALLRIPLQINLAAQAFLRWLRPGSSLPLLFLKDMPKPGTKLRLDLSSLLGPLFYMWVWQMLYPVLLASLVYEKEKNLRTMMRMHGLTDLPYWIVMYTWFLALSVAYMIIFVVVGSAIQLKFFLLNNYGIQIIFYFVFLNNQIAWTFLTATIFSKTKTATVSGYLYVFGSGLLGQFLLRFFLEDQTFPGTGIFFLEWIPCFALYRGLYELAQAAFIGNYQGTHGMGWSNLSDSQNGLVTALVILLVEWAIFLLLGYYLDQVVASGSGVRKPWLFFLGKRSTPSLAPANRRASAEVGVDMERPDVAAERAAVAQLKDGTGENVIVCKNLNKVFPSRDGNAPKVAVKSLALAVPRGECFGMLGPNGAGKTTSINMMVGFLQPTSGTALIEGLDIRSDMTRIYSIMGVCPQHDLLWESLSGREHLLFYGRLKNLHGEALQAAVERSLRSVNLYAGGVGNKRAGQYSGGMKRRLSVAISLIGDPLVVYMDEPSTGLDPASRNNLWQVVRNAKKDRAIILTTHSMEEAEVLCDRLGIFVDGQFQCIGNPKELTARYGGSFVFSITTLPHEMDAVGELVHSLSPGARRVYAVSGTQRFELPTSEVDLAQVFAAVERAKSRLQIQAWGIANTTLEDVFVKISKEAQLGERTLS